MCKLPSYFLAAFALVLGLPAVRGEENLDVPVETIGGEKPGGMTHRYAIRQADAMIARWQADYEQRKTPAEIAAYQKRLREAFLQAIGGLPERTPLNPAVTGVVMRSGYRVEKIIFESQPKHYVTALLFLPDQRQFTPPYPGVLVPCGHAPTAKAFSEFQTMGALLALNGMAALVFDPIDQGERGQYFGEGGWPKLWGTAAHTTVGMGCVLLGQNTARFEIWDGMCAIDYLQSRPEVDPERIGCTGCSGGGTQTSYLMALDARIGPAAPSCYLTSTRRLSETMGADDSEQQIFGQLAVGLHEADFIMMRAPAPVLMCTATHDFFDIQGSWDTFRCAKRLYTRMGCAERVDLLEEDGEHGYRTIHREGAARWMARWLLQNDQPLSEPKITLLTEAECLCTTDGKVMSLPGARSVYDLNEDYENELAMRRAALWAQGERTQLLAEVRRLIGARRLAELPQPRVESFGIVARPGYKIERLLLWPEDDIAIPSLLFLPDKSGSDEVVLYVHEQGKATDAGRGGPVERLVLSGAAVLAVDLRGTGQTRSTFQGWGGPEYQDAYCAYLLGRSSVGTWAEDILVCARYAAERRAAGRQNVVQLVAIGKVGVAALHAAALEPALFQSTRLTRTLVSWSNVIHNRLNQGQATNFVHGALLHYDLPDLKATLGGTLTVIEPVNAVGTVVAEK